MLLYRLSEESQVKMSKKYKISEEIIARIFKAIQDKGLRQKEVAKKMGISESELAEMKAGRTRISFRLEEYLTSGDI